MSFLKDFKNELSQAVNELVNIDDDTVKKEDTQEISDSSEQFENDVQMGETDQSEDEELINDDGSEEIDMQVSDGEDDDTENEEITEEDAEEGLLEDLNLDNIDISDYLEDEEMEESNKVEEKSEEILKELASDIKSEINDEKLEEMMADDRESRKAALRSAVVEENYRKDNSEKEEVALASDEITEITKGTMIEGNLVSEGSINIYGKIKGNVASRGKLVISGTIIGSSRGAEIFTNNAMIKGDVTSDGSLKIGNGSVIMGNVYGSSAVIAGAVQGDVDIHGPVIIDGTAVIQGNIRSRSVQVNNGAAIEGMISQCYAEIDYAALFDKTFSNN